jgi:hypothetical protein
VFKLNGDGASIMIRKIAIGLAAAVIATGGATLGASAARGGGGHGGGAAHYGGGHHGGMAHYGGYAKGMYRPGRQYGQYGYGRYRHDYWRYRHEPRYGYRTYGTYGGGSCWRWTPEGRVWSCGYGRPYGYSGYYREHYRPHYYGHYGPRYGHYGPRYGGGHRPVYGRR